jgi:ABC-type transport system substrate-binding protein
MVSPTKITRRTMACTSVILALLLAVPSLAGTRPHYGGTVRVLIQHKIMSLDPVAESDYSPERDKLGSLIFETLTTIDNQGHIRNVLAFAWQPDSSRRIWQFQLRNAVFHDGTPITSAAVIASLKAVAPDWKFTASGRQAFSIETPAPSPHLVEILSLPKYSIFKRLADNSLVGSGPFKVSTWLPGERAVFTANEDHWGGRPFPDAVEVTMGSSLREHLTERNLGPDHATELNLDQVRGIESASQNLAFSRPAELLVMIFLQSDRTAGTKKPVNPHLREAVALATNRAAINNVLFQRRGAPAGGLLPQWMTGYAFLFPAAPDVDQARKLRTEAGASGPVSLAYDYSDAGARIVAERIAVDAREAGITVQPFGDGHINSRAGRRASGADAVLLRVPLRSSDAAAALAGLADDLDMDTESAAAIMKAGRPDELLSAEQKALENFRIVPVVHLPQTLWLNRNIHNWQQQANGNWRLEQVWVESGR